MSSAQRIPVATTEAGGGRTVVRTIGLVYGSTIRARHIGRDIVAALRSLVGGEIKDYTKLMAEAREQALERMIEAAEAAGGNAVVGMRFSTSMVMSGASEILAYGTAVVVE